MNDSQTEPDQCMMVFDELSKRIVRRFWRHYPDQLPRLLVPRMWFDLLDLDPADGHRLYVDGRAVAMLDHSGDQLDVCLPSVGGGAA